MSLKLKGATSGSIELDVPAAIGSDLSITIPSTAGEVAVKATDGSVDLGNVNIDSSGRVGIGTTSPGQKLVVKDTSAASTSTYVNVISGNTGNAGIIFGDSDADSRAGVLYNNDDEALRFFKSGFSEAARIDSSGRLLVGTSTASTNALLQVAGDSSSTNASGSIFLHSNYAAGSLGGSDGLGIISAGSNNGGVGASISFVADDTWGTNDYPTRLVFSTTADTSSSPVERMRITSDAYVRLASGTGGIQFNGDTASANALDDYEEGTWTPTYVPTTGSFGSITYDSIRYGKYTKIGNLVTCVFALRTDALTVGTASGIVKVGGLPFTAALTSAFDAGTMAISYSQQFGGDVPDSGLVADGTTECPLNYRATSNGNSVGLDVSDLGTGLNNNYIIGSISYVVS